MLIWCGVSLYWPKDNGEIYPAVANKTKVVDESKTLSSCSKVSDIWSRRWFTIPVWLQIIFDTWSWGDNMATKNDFACLQYVFLPLDATKSSPLVLKCSVSCHVIVFLTALLCRCNGFFCGGNGYLLFCQESSARYTAWGTICLFCYNTFHTRLRFCFNCSVFFFFFFSKYNG